MNKKCFEKFTRVSKNQTCLKKIKYRNLKIQLLRKIFEKVNVSITKIKVVKKKIKNDRYLKLKVSTKKNYKIEQRYNKNQACLEKIEDRYLKTKIA